MESLQTILTIAGTAAGLLITTVTFLVKFVKAVAEKNAAKASNILRRAAEDAVQFVEGVKSKANGELDGSTKLTMALTRVNQALIDAGVEYDECKSTKVIEEIVTLTKSVNARDKDVANREVNI